MEGDYVRYCFDEAVIYFGLTLESMLQDAGQKPSKEGRREELARASLINKIFGNDKKKGTGYADPALMFK